jgi:alpha-beta hydrolase superfamily lysophospholipase
MGGVRVPRFESDATPASIGLAFTTHRYPSSDRIELEAWRIPCENARGLVLVFHGYSSGKAAQLAVARELHALGFESFLVDFRGSGGSTGSVTTLGLHEADDVAASVSVATSGATVSPFLYGTSMGGAAVLRAVHEGKVAPRGAVLECTFGRLVDTVKSRFALMGVPAFPSAQLLVFWGGGLEGFSHEPVEYARDVHFPVLLLAGEKDPTISIDQTRELEANLGGPKELVTFAEGRHEGYLGRDPGRWREAVSRFLVAH